MLKSSRILGAGSFCGPVWNCGKTEEVMITTGSLNVSLKWSSESNPISDTVTVEYRVLARTRHARHFDG